MTEVGALLVSACIFWRRFSFREFVRVFASQARGNSLATQGWRASICVSRWLKSMNQSKCSTTVYSKLYGAARAINVLLHTRIRNLILRNQIRTHTSGLHFRNLLRALRRRRFLLFLGMPCKIEDDEKISGVRVFCLRCWRQGRLGPYAITK